MTVTPHSAEALAVRERLARREAELQAIVRMHTLDAAVDGDRSTGDFKELAEVDTQATVDEAQSAAAMAELQSLRVARARLDEGAYGQCVECGEEIDPRRLAALPSALYCAPCQGQHERRAIRAA